MKEKIRIGSIVYVKYKDHVLFHRVNPGLVLPSVQEAIGWLAKEETNWIQMVWNRDYLPNLRETKNLLCSGLVILKSDILELREVPALECNH